MRILHLSYDHINNPWLGGGGAKILHEVYRRLRKRHEVTVLTGAWPGVPAWEVIDGVRYSYAHPALGRITSRLSYAGRGGLAASSGRCDLIVDDVSPFSPTFAGALSRRPCIASVLLDLFSSARKHPIIAPIALSLLKWNLNRHNSFIVLSPSLEGLVREKVGTDRAVAVIPPGVDDELFEARPQEEGFLLFLGRLDMNHKGLDCLVSAWDLLKERRKGLELVIAGGGPDEGQLREMLRRRGLTDSVKFVGWVKGSAKADVLRKCLAVCMPSRREGWGIVALEAAACGKPTVGFDVVGLRDAVLNGQTGLLVPCEDVTALADAIMRIIDDVALRRSLGDNARERARDFTWDKTARRYESFFEQVLSQRHGAQR